MKASAIVESQRIEITFPGGEVVQLTLVETADLVADMCKAMVEVLEEMEVQKRR